uniref:Protein kinase domain-containing protein n=1 Tax=Oryza barthii TaxID=65489 RepID=A0A0D3GKL6_9ORYZ
MTKHHPMLLFLGLAVLALQPLIAAASRRPPPPPLCPKKCGNVDIEYPFGIGPNCSLSDDFSLECVHDTPQLRLGTDRQQVVAVLDINLLHGKIRIANSISWQCKDENDPTGAPLKNSSWTGLDVTELPYRFSYEDNQFVTVGCNVLVLLSGEEASVDPILNVCMSTCFGNGSNIRNGYCSGAGCCEMAIPVGLKSYRLEFSGPLLFNSSWSPDNYTWCSHAVLMEAKSFSFERDYATTDKFFRNKNGTVPVVHNFAAGSEKCKEARMKDTYACVSDHSACVGTADGYVCNCTSGYKGNPYLPGGCTEGEHKSNKSGVLICEPDLKRSLPDLKFKRSYRLPVSAIIAIGVTGGIAIIVMSILSSYLVHQRRALADIKRSYFKRHGGLLLYEELNARKSNAFTIYTEEQLEQATNGFDESNVLGRGGHGTVYKGWVAAASDDLVVAIKRCKLMDERNKKEFGKEMLILSQVNHKNIVKLLGCCLEVDVPMLVYEYVPNGTLYQLIHGGSAGAISFASRLRIAHESAESLAYLHSLASPPILHGDVKSSNILLDESFMAQVSDFGASILAPTDEAQMMTMVQLTEKSDVYSFGVVLLELLTGKKPLCLDGPDEGRSLSARFLAAMRENRADLILDEQVKSEASGELLEEITLLALECLQMCGGDRPAMKEVAERLGGLRKLHQHPWTQDVVELDEVRCLLSDSPESISFEVDATSSSGY